MGRPFAKPVPVDNTKNKVGNPLANRVPPIGTALLVHQVVSIYKVLVLLAPIPIWLSKRAKHVPTDNTTLEQLLLIIGTVGGGDDGHGGLLAVHRR